MSAELYKCLHLVGIVLTFLGFGLLLGRAMVSAGGDKRVRKLGTTLSGSGLFLVLLSGFGLLAKVYNNSIPSWVIPKMIIWGVLGGLTALAIRKLALASKLVWIFAALATTAIYLVVFKPF